MSSTIIPKTLIIVPAFNEEEAIEQTLSNLMNLKKELIGLDVCVINDGSIDQTSKLAKKFAITVIDLPFNLGIGSAVQTGYKYAYENDYEIAVQFDADGQHNEKDFLSMIQPIIDSECDMVVGSRFFEKTDYKGSFMRRLGIYYFTFLLKILTFPSL